MERSDIRGLPLNIRGIWRRWRAGPGCRFAPSGLHVL